MTVLTAKSQISNFRAPVVHFRALEKAREAVIKLETLKPFLTSQDEETLAILMDKKLMTSLEKSLKEADEGKYDLLFKQL